MSNTESAPKNNVSIQRTDAGRVVENPPPVENKRVYNKIFFHRSGALESLGTIKAAVMMAVARCPMKRLYSPARGIT